MSLISRSAGGSPPGKSISGLSMLTSLAPAGSRKGNRDQSYIPAADTFAHVARASHLRQDVHGEDQRGVLLDSAAGRRVVAVAQLRRNGDQHPAADLLAGQALRPALDDLLERERRQLLAAVRRVELLAGVPHHALVLHEQRAVGRHLVAVALDDVLRHELGGRVRLGDLDRGGLAVGVGADLGQSRVALRNLLALGGALRVERVLDVDDEHQRVGALDTRLRVALLAVPPGRRDGELDPAAGLLARQGVPPAVDDAVLRELDDQRRLTVVGVVEDLGRAPDLAEVVGLDVVALGDGGAAARDDRLDREILRRIAAALGDRRLLTELRARRDRRQRTVDDLRRRRLRSRGRRRG